MAADSLLPLFHESPPQLLPEMTDLSNDDVIAELLAGTGEDLLASLLDPNSVYPDQFSPPLSSPPLTNSYTASQLPCTSSPTSDGGISEGSRALSPYSYTSCSPNSPESASDVMVTSSCNILPSNELDALLGSLASSSDIKINVDAEPGARGLLSGGESSTAATGGGKATTLVLTEEEKLLLSAEGIELPTDMPLTKNEQKHLKRVRRKIKNKLSAQESRRKKKDYVEGLEDRVQSCTDTNIKLRKRVDSLETENKTLAQQLSKLHSLVAQLYPSKLQAGTLIMVISLSFSLLVWPRPPGSTPSSHTVTVHSRALLFAETDEFGNIIDPESGAIVSEYGGHTPRPPYPWSLQTPAFLSGITRPLPPTARPDPLPPRVRPDL